MSDIRWDILAQTSATLKNNQYIIVVRTVRFRKTRILQRTVSTENKKLYRI